MSEIIIDDVNVEECSYYNKDNAPYCCEVWDNECEAQNCYYKQLKHLQVENKRLNSICLQLQNSESKQHLEKVNCERENYKLHKENEELKKRQITKNGFICDCEQNVKYKQALEEIREIADEETNTDRLLHYKELRHYKNYCAILDIISEVLG